MIRPSKHAHPDLTVISMAYVILERIRKVRSEKYSELFKQASKLHQDADNLFLPAVNFLFLLGLIKYYPKGDRFEYVGLK